MALHGRTARHSPFSTSLRRHCPTSAVLFARPTTRNSFVILLSLSDIPLHRICTREITGSPQLTQMSLYSMADLRPRDANHKLAFALYGCVAFHVVKHVGTPESWFRGCNALWPYCLASYAWPSVLPQQAQGSLSVVRLHLTEWGFHPLNIASLAGRTYNSQSNGIQNRAETIRHLLMI